MIGFHCLGADHTALMCYWSLAVWKSACHKHFANFEEMAVRQDCSRLFNNDQSHFCVKKKSYLQMTSINLRKMEVMQKISMREVTGLLAA